MKFTLTIFLSIVATLLLAQSKHDYTWLMGIQPGGQDYPINCMNTLNFKDNKLTIDKSMIDVQMFVTNASCSGNNGNLLFYTNGCYVKDANNNIMPNGSLLNPGLIYDDNCPDYGYTARGGIVILPMPGASNKYFVLHQAIDVFNTSPFVRVNRLYYSIVDMQQNNGLGDVVEKNQIILTSQLQTGIQAVKHENNSDWWMMAMKQNGNTYYKVLLTENGVVEVDSQIIGGILSLNGGGQISFSPDGTKFAKFDFMDQLMLFDFDRSTGFLSNYQKMKIDTNELAFCGLAFSPNSKRLYLSTQQKLWQLNLETTDILASKTLIGEFDGFVYELFNVLYPVTFQRMQLGPDCKIYMTSQGPVAYMHVINNPDELGTACNFEQRGLPLPCSVNYSIPNFPHYRLGTGQPVCDSSIVYVSSGYVPPPEEEVVRVWPNPASSEVRVELSATVSTKTSTLRLFDGTGRLVGQWELSAGSHEATLSLSNLPDGMYFWHVESWGIYVKSGKLIISR